MKRFRSQRITTLDEAFRRFDRNKDGKIDFGEMVACLRSLDVGMADHQCYDLMRSLDTNLDACVDMEEFEARFEPVFARLNGPSQPGDLDAWTTEQLRTLSSEIHRKRGGLTAAFQKFDPTGRGFFDVGSFTRILGEVGCIFFPPPSLTLVI